MLLAHLSDPHITTGALAHQPATGLQRALARVLALAPRPDCVVITGDLVDRQSPEEYAVLREVIGRFPLPLHLVAGNHDGRGPLLAEFADTGQVGSTVLADGVQACYAVDYPDARLVVLDSLDEGTPDGQRGAGRMGATQLTWLDGVLAERADAPAFVALHHPPIAVGIPFMDSIRLLDGPELAAVIARHPHVVRVLAGHLHRTVTASFAGTTLTVAPSTYKQVELRMGEGMVGYLHEPTSVLLHLLSTGEGATSCVTHSVAVSHAGAVAGSF